MLGRICGVDCVLVVKLLLVCDGYILLDWLFLLPLGVSLSAQNPLVCDIQATAKTCMNDYKKED